MSLEQQLRIEFPRPAQYEVLPGSKLGRALKGLDPHYALQTLPDIDREILETRYGMLTGGQVITQRQASEQIGIPSARISRREAKALGRLVALREMYKPEKPFYRYRDSLYIDGSSYWGQYPQPVLHSTWEDEDDLRLVEEGKYMPRYVGNPSEAYDVG